MLLLKAILLSSLWAFGLGQLEQPELSISRAPDESVYIPCKASISNFKNVAIHWYRQKSKQGFEHLMYVWTAFNQYPLGGVNKKLEASKNYDTSTSHLKINFLKKEDEATYYCTYWDFYAKKVFGGGTKLVVIDKSSDGDISPKPTIFLPSVAERNRDKAGTYLCLLENFFPDVIKVYWKEKDGNTILKSQEGDTMKTNDTYTKLSWLTVTGVSMDEEHKRIVKHEKNQGRVDQEILFPPVNQIRSTSKPEACMNDENGLLDLQVTSTSAYYTYLLLLLKSAVHGALNTYCLCRRYPDFCYGKST